MNFNFLWNEFYSGLFFLNTGCFELRRKNFFCFLKKKWKTRTRSVVLLPMSMLRIRSALFYVGLLFLALGMSPVFSAEYEKSGWIPLWKGTAPGASPLVEKEVDLDSERITRPPRPEIQIWTSAEKSAGPRPALCIFPGGGYSLLAVEKEGVKIAQWAVDHGMVGIIVKYRVSNKPEDNLRFPVPLIEARRAVRIVRQNAEAWGVNPEKVGVMGFSAGGHLAAVTATTWNKALEGETQEAVDKLSARPDFALLIYPVISLDKSYGHSGTRYGILKDDKSQEKLEFCSPYKQVSVETPPLFLALSFDDPILPLNSLDMARAACEKGVSVELHMVTKGGHGYGMKKTGNPTDAWPERAREWLTAIKILPKQEKPKPE